MNKDTKLCCIASYLTWIGWIFAFIKKKDDDKLALRHLNQALVINLMTMLGTAMLLQGGRPLWYIGQFLEYAALMYQIQGLIRAVKLSDKPLPLIGDIHIIDR